MRYFPQTDNDTARMLETIGAGSVDELFNGLPENIHLKRDLKLDPPMDEIALTRHMEALAADGAGGEVCFAGGGFYDHFIPAVVDAVAGRSEFYTAYTPYQPEASQGHLQVFFEYQTMICKLTGMDVSNASMYDGASAAAEAGLMGVNLKRKIKQIAVAENMNPEYQATIKTYMHWAGIECVTVKAGEDGRIDQDDLAVKAEGSAIVLFQNPNFFGLIEDGAAICDIAHSKEAYAGVSIDPVSLGMLKRPGDYGADIVTGEGQPLGNPVCYGGHGFGIMATTEEFIRKIPGRVVGRTVDQNGTDCCVLTLQTREQHIRRSRATSNICSNQAWCVTRSVIHMTALGPKGLEAAARISADRAHYLAQACSTVDGCSLPYDNGFFKEFVLRCPVPASEVYSALRAEGILGGLELSRYMPERNHDLLICATEKRTQAECDAFAAILAKVTN